MAKDPAFLFYPGDYLRDTQCMSEPAQVAYDRIMCEHMRNISSDMINISKTQRQHNGFIGVSKAQVNFFIKRLSAEDKESLMRVLTENSHGFYIEWVAESLIKRRAYSESRRQNRLKNNE